ncbi:MAG TPA: YegS/Rv2252/BmrU family lipid kinase [Actinomycetota bacterium]|nr:YegS/Rv2252/BmrU family lipid kinase [Actinomycetota bacterium]
MTSPFGRLVLIVDRRPGGLDLSGVLNFLRQRDLTSRSIEVNESPEAIQATREALKAGERFIVAVGDDGTIHDVVNGMIEDDRPIGEGPILGVLPTTSEVDFIKTFGLPPDLERASGYLEGGGTFSIDLGKITYVAGSPAPTQTRYFANAAQAGLSGTVLARSERLRRWLGRAGYFTAFWTTLGTYRPARGHVTVDGKSLDTSVRDFVVANCQFHRGGLMISPRSWPGDGLLDVLVMTGPKSEAFTDLPKMYRGEHLPHRHIVEMKGRTIAFEADRPLVVEADGRVLGHTPATFQLLRQPISVKI